MVNADKATTMVRNGLAAKDLSKMLLRLGSARSCPLIKSYISCEWQV